jgi:antirestriction protein
LETIVSIVEAINEHGKAFTIYYKDLGDLESAKAHFEDAYQGEYDSLLDYATQLFDELYAYDLPEHISCYIDYDAFSHDLEAEGYFIEGGHVFRPV